MSSRSEAVTPHPEGEATSPSAARNALQSHLESGLTLTRKKSWFGSAREWASKGAHNARGYFDKYDGMKAETSRRRQLALGEAHDGELLSPELECSDDDPSATPFKPTPPRHHTFTPKNAMASLRQHTLSAKGRHKRGALSDTHEPAADHALANLHTPTPAGDAPKGHTRNSSVTKSLVGSIRGFARKANAARTIPPEKVLEQRESSSSSSCEEAAFVPLPSSPINITPLPTLSLDLPPSALVPDSFGRTPPDDTALMRQTDSKNIINARPVPTYYTRIPGEGPVDQLSLTPGPQDRTWSPRELLGLQADDLGRLPSPGPATPMPGTNCSLEFDSNSVPATGSLPLVQVPPEQNFTKHVSLDGANDEIELFERNVEYKDEIKKKENRTLKKMVSLDAMAEECAALSPNRRNVSGVTIKGCPDDMPLLTRQWARLQTPSAGHRCPQTGNWKSEDPFAPGNAVGDLAVDRPPTLGAQVILPLRPKITLQSADGAEPRTLNDNDLPMVVERIEDSVAVSSQPTASTDKVQVCAWSDIEMPPHNNPSFVPGMTSVGGHKVTPVAAPDPAGIDERDVAVRPQTPVRGTATSDSNAGDTCRDPLGLDTLSSSYETNDVDDAKDHVAYEPSIDGSDQDSMHGPLHRKSSVMQIYELLTNTQTPSPKRVTTGFINSNSATAFWKFRQWGPNPPFTKHSQKDTTDDSNRAVRDAPPPRRPRSGDLDVEASEPCQIPDASSAVSAVGASPNTGDRVEFDGERANRAQRFVALPANPEHYGENDAVVYEDMDSVNIPSPLRPVHNNETGPQEGGPSTKDQSPSKARSRRDSGQASCYSIDSDLQADLAGVYELQNAIAGTTFDPNPILAEASGPMTPVPSAQALPQIHDDDGKAESQSTDGYASSLPSEDTPALSPGETKFWRDVQSCPFDTPRRTPAKSPTHSLHKRQSTAMFSAMPSPGENLDGINDAAVENAILCATDDEFGQAAARDDVPRTDSEQTLDEGLKLYHSYTSNPEMRYSDTPTAPDQESPKSPFASPDSGYNPDRSSDAEGEPLSPSRYRRRKTTMATPPR